MRTENKSRLTSAASSVGNRSSADDSRDYSTEDETVIDPEQGNGRITPRVYHYTGLTDIAVVLMHIISQLRPGADLSRVTLPTFILEPRSMLERITKSVFLNAPATQPLMGH